LKSYIVPLLLVCAMTAACVQPSATQNPTFNSGSFPLTNNGASTPTAVPPSSGNSELIPTLDAEESAFVVLINAYRLQNGLGKLQVSAALTQSSKWMSTDMAAKDYFSHTDSLGRDPFTRMTTFNYGYGGYEAENIAAGNASAQDTFTQWKNSPGHNANMLGANYNVIGVGRASGGGYGWYWTTDFGSTVDATL
jgi:uncharacterized protein YkwD